MRPVKGLTCVSVSISDVATSKRFGLDRYLLSLNWFSSSNSCWLVKAVRGLRHFPSRLDWGPAAAQGAKWQVGSSAGTAPATKHRPHLFPRARVNIYCSCSFDIILKYLSIKMQRCLKGSAHNLIYLMPRTWEVQRNFRGRDVQAHICPHSAAIINYNGFTSVYCWRGGTRQKRVRGP